PGVLNSAGSSSAQRRWKISGAAACPDLPAGDACPNVAFISRLRHNLRLEMTTEETGPPDNGAAIERRIAGRLAALRTERGWTLEALAGKSGISRATLSRLERGELSPTAAMLGKLCAVHGWTLSRLMADAENTPPDLVRAADQVSWQDPESG